MNLYLLLKQPTGPDMGAAVILLKEAYPVESIRYISGMGFLYRLDGEIPADIQQTLGIVVWN